MTELACPLCKAALREVNREGVTIDVCGQCRGIWLDRGELDKLLEIARQPDASFQAVAHPAQYQGGHPAQYQGGTQGLYQGDRGMRRHYDDDDDDDRRRYGGDGRHYRKKSRFESIFDIFD